MTLLDSVGPAVSGGQQAWAWFNDGLGNLAAHLGLLLGALGVSAAVAGTAAWIIAGGLVVGTGYKFRQLIALVFVGAVAFAVVAGIGVKVWG